MWHKQAAISLPTVMVAIQVRVTTLHLVYSTASRVSIKSGLHILLLSAMEIRVHYHSKFLMQNALLHFKQHKSK